MMPTLPDNTGGDGFHHGRFAGAFRAPPSDRNDALIEARTSYPPTVDIGDLIRVDFEQRQFKSEGLYLITDHNEWIGIRRFDVTGHGWRIYDDSDGKPRLLDDKTLAELQVIGLVKAVYKQRKT